MGNKKFKREAKKPKKTQVKTIAANPSTKLDLKEINKSDGGK